MIRPIVLWPDPVLSRRCEPVAEIDDEIRTLVGDMFETMYAAPGRGLAAPQVGVSLRLFVMDVGWKSGEPTPIAMVNPAIEWMSDERVSGDEGCLSIPGVTATVDRADRIRMHWTDLDGQRLSRTLDGFEAICAQHEYDHLDGIVTFDRIAKDARLAMEERYFA